MPDHDAYLMSGPGGPHDDSPDECPHCYECLDSSGVCPECGWSVEEWEDERIARRVDDE